MNGAAHASFIAASYGATLLIVGGLILWLLIDHRTQSRKLEAMEARKIRQRPNARPEAEQS